MYTHTQKVNEDVAADTEERKGFDLSRGCQGWGLRVLGSGVKVSVVGLRSEAYHHEAYLYYCMRSRRFERQTPNTKPHLTGK